MISESIKKEIEKGESKTVEFVSDSSDIAHIARTVCAFLNGKGGTVFGGVDDNGKPTGVRNPTRLVQDIRKHLQSKITPNASLLSVTLDNLEGSHVISIDVPAGTSGPYVYDGAVYIRSGATTKPADATTLHLMIQKVSGTTELWEKRISTGLEANDLDKQEIREMVEQAEKSGRLVFSKPSDFKAVLKDLGLLRSDSFTQAADILFAKSPALRHPQIRVRATCFAEDKESSEFIDDKVFEGPLVKMLKEAEKFIKRNMRTSVSFQNSGLQTKDRIEYPSNAIREGIVNAFAHRDYDSFHGGVAIRFYPSRLEIWNTGHLANPLKPSDLTKNHPSIPVNPDIVHVLYIRGYMNRIGRGTQNIVNLCREHGLRTPSWKDDTTGVTLTFYARTKLGGTQGAFNVRQIALLSKLKPGEEIRPSEYRKKFAEKMNERQARRDLKQLEDSNMLERVGSGAAARFRRTTREWMGKKRT